MTDPFNHMDELFRDGLKDYTRSKPSGKTWRKISRRLTFSNMLLKSRRIYWVMSGIALVGIGIIFILIKPIQDNQKENKLVIKDNTNSPLVIKEPKTSQTEDTPKPDIAVGEDSSFDELIKKKDFKDDDHQQAGSSVFSKKTIQEDTIANDHHHKNHKRIKEEQVTNNTIVDQPADSVAVSTNEQTVETNILPKLNTNEIDSQDAENKVERNKHKINTKDPKQIKEPENTVNKFPELQKKINEKGTTAEKTENNDADNISQKQSSTVNKRPGSDTVPDTSFSKDESNNKIVSAPEKKKQHKTSLITGGGVALTNRFLAANNRNFEEDVKILNEGNMAQIQPYAFIGMEFHFKNSGISTGLEYSSYKMKGEYKLDSLIIDTLYSEMNIVAFQQLDYVEIPLMYHHSFRYKKYRIFAGGGLSLGILTGRAGKTYRFNNQTYTVHDLQTLPLEKLNAFWHGRVSAGRKVFNDFEINLDLRYKQALMSVYSDEYDFSLKPYSISLGLSLRYYF